MNILLNPYDEHPDMEHYAWLPPDWATQISVEQFFQIRLIYPSVLTVCH